MPLEDIPREQLKAILSQIDQAIYNHQRWHNDVVRTLVCRLPPNELDIVKESHTLCRFGQWYYRFAPKELNSCSEFEIIGKAHMQMHNSTRIILNESINSNAISMQTYDHFSNSLDHFRLEINDLKREIENLVNTRDPLTQTFTRDTMLPMLREKQSLLNRSSDAYCLAMLDIDHFKQVNDTYGHDVGDKVLTFLTKYITTHLRKSDTVFRYGGEEFLILLQQNSLKQAFGISMLDADHSVEDSINLADKALYCAKTRGRNRTVTDKEI